MKTQNPRPNRADIQYHLLKGIVRLLSAVPPAWMRAAGTLAGLAWYALDRRHRQIARHNLALAFGKEMPASRRQTLVRRNFVQLARLALELPMLCRIRKDNLSRHITISGEKHLSAAIGRGKGVLILTAHLGNWELMALAASLKLNLPIHVVARTLDHGPLNRLLTEIRCRTGNRVVNKQNGAARMVRLLRNKQVLAILLDQNASWYDGVQVPFFGKTAWTNKGLALFALRYGAAVLPAFNIRRSDGRYHVIIAPPVELVRSGDLERDIAENTARFNTIIERHIRMAPDNWLWIHRRWREKPIPPRVLEKQQRKTDPPVRPSANGRRSVG